MPIQPITRDVNGFPLPNHGTETVTRRFVGINSTQTEIKFNSDVKHVILHIEGASEIARMTGASAGSQEIVWTDDGVTIPSLSVVRLPNMTVVKISAPIGETINVSAIGWR